ncbi:DinB family protein [Paenibacillus sp. BJ-4]|uniref:DinB family protein n=1 Tax=Paenibacillus sp. BJ-4 TaxID=2878097 RepID=UPI001CF0060D|nr:DinB family protein [Paenibacillus sp. BJ-4]
MKNAVEELTRLIENHEKELFSISEHEFNAKPLPEKWSKKEILGHLCDSASNNHRRFIIIKHSTSPVKIESYAQNDWVTANQYQKAFSHMDVIHLWKLLNKQIIHVLNSCTSLDFKKRFQKEDQSTETLQWLVDDYIQHMRHHLEQIRKK